MSNIDILLGQSIARQRTLRCMSQDDLAARLGVCAHVISAFEQGTRRIPAKQLFDLADVLEVRIEEIFCLEDTVDQAPRVPALSPEIQVLFGDYGALSKMHRSAIFAFLLALKRDQKQNYASSG